MTISNNGYRAGLTVMPGDLSTTTNLVMEFESGPMTNHLGYLGSFYYPTNGTSNSLTNLINTGSRLASAAGLFHYLTTTNQVREGSSTVDIGFHYVALDEAGQPVDSDGDGIPDYLEDANGNGSVDDGETDWDDAEDLGLRVFITEPKNNSNLP